VEPEGKMIDRVASMIAAAKAWRGMARLVVLVCGRGSLDHTQELDVQLGPSRRRWKRVADALAGVADDIEGARGYDAKGALVGSWDTPEDDDPEPEGAAGALSAETDDQAAHRQHTQWCFRQAATMYEASMRLTNELVMSTIEIVRAVRPSASTPAESETSDDTTKTLGLILQSVMQPRNERNDHAEPEDQRAEGGPSGEPAGQGQPTERP
jgi:hypothetical protein